MYSLYAEKDFTAYFTFPALAICYTDRQFSTDWPKAARLELAVKFSLGDSTTFVSQLFQGNSPPRQCLILRHAAPSIIVDPVDWGLLKIYFLPFRQSFPLKLLLSLSTKNLDLLQKYTLAFPMSVYATSDTLLQNEKTSKNCFSV